MNIFGVRVDPVTLESAVSRIEEKIAGKGGGYVCVNPSAAIVRAYDDPALRSAMNDAFLSTPDGKIIVSYLKRKGYAGAERVCGRDLMSAMFDVSETRGYRHYFYGTTDDTLLRLQDNLLKKYPSLHICGMKAPPFRETTEREDREIIMEINGADPDIVWVAIGCPKQEKWMANNASGLKNAVMIGVGAAFNFHAGIVQTAPTWMQERGVEWLFRLMCEPRLLGRYIYTNPKFIYLLVKDKLGLMGVSAKGKDK